MYNLCLWLPATIWNIMGTAEAPPWPPAVLPQAAYFPVRDDCHQPDMCCVSVCVCVCVCVCLLLHLTVAYGGGIHGRSLARICCLVSHCPWPCLSISLLIDIYEFLVTFIFAHKFTLLTFPIAQQVEDPVLSLLWLGWLLWPGFDSWPRNLHMSQAQPKKKKKKKEKVDYL